VGRGLARRAKGGPRLGLNRLASAADLAVLRLCVVPDVRSRRAPSVMTALAGVVHRRQRATDPKHDKRENDQ
jgi:hypothetical protein